LNEQKETLGSLVCSLVNTGERLAGIRRTSHAENDLENLVSSACLLVSAGVAVAALATRKPPAEPPTPAYCKAGGNWLSLNTTPPKPIPVSSDIVAHAVRQDVVLLGEQHDSEDHHRWQLQTLSALHAQRPEMVIGFEMFPRRVQPVLDQWVAGELTAQEFLKQAEWDKVWSFPPAHLHAPVRIRPHQQDPDAGAQCR
jgi:hypothetical protein